MLIVLLKRFAVPIPIIGVGAVALIRWKRNRDEKKRAASDRAAPASR